MSNPHSPHVHLQGYGGTSGKIPPRQAPGHIGENPRAHFPPSMGVVPAPHAGIVLTPGAPGAINFANIFTPPFDFILNNHVPIKGLRFTAYNLGKMCSHFRS